MIGIRRSIEPRAIGERDEPGAGPPSHHLQAPGDQGAVDADEGRDVGNSRQGDKVEERHQVGNRSPAAQLAVRLDKDQKHHRRCAQMAKRSALIWTVRVYNGEGVRERRRAEMMIEDDNIRAGRSSDRVMRQRSAVDTDDQLVFRCQACHRPDIRPVAFCDPVGDVDRRVETHLGQPAFEQSGRRSAIHVVVGEDRDALSLDRRRDEALGRGARVLERERVGKHVAQRRGEEGSRAIGKDATAHQAAADRVLKAGDLHHRLGQTLGLGS